MQTINYITGLFSPLARQGPTGEQNPPVELVHLVQSKVSEQDHRYRKALGYFKKLGINASTIALVFRDKDLETYILVLITLLLEEWLNVLKICSSKILDAREFLRIELTAATIMDLVNKRVETLQGELRSSGETTFQSALLDFRGGLFYEYYRNSIFQGSQDADSEMVNITKHIQDGTLLDGLPSDALHTDEPAALHYTTWDEHAERSQGEVDVDDKPPISWDTTEDNIPVPDWPRVALPFPYNGITTCDDCARCPISEMHCFTCIECTNKDFCSPCWHSGKTRTQGHMPDHSVIRMALSIPYALRIWMIALARHEYGKLINDILFFSFKSQPLVVRGSNDQYISDAALITETSLPCTRCETPLNLQSTAYVCIMHGCKDHILCENCDAVDDPENEHGTHKSWHTMLVVRDLQLFVTRDSDEPQTFSEVVYTNVSQAETTDGRIQQLESRVVSLESELRTANNEIKDMIGQLMTKMNSMTLGPAAVHSERSMGHGGVASTTVSGSYSSPAPIVVAQPTVPPGGMTYSRSYSSPEATHTGHPASGMYEQPVTQHPTQQLHYQQEFADDEEEDTQSPGPHYGQEYADGVPQDYYAYSGYQ